MYKAAYEAWAVARADIYARWTEQSDPANLAVTIPAVLRRAAALVRVHGGFLGDQQDRLAQRLSAPHGPAVERAARAAEVEDIPIEAKVRGLALLADQLGLVPLPPPQVLPLINTDDIHLVVWTAILPATRAHRTSWRGTGLARVAPIDGAGPVAGLSLGGWSTISAPSP